MGVCRDARVWIVVLRETPVSLPGEGQQSRAHSAGVIGLFDTKTDPGVDTVTEIPPDQDSDFLEIDSIVHCPNRRARVEYGTAFLAAPGDAEVMGRTVWRFRYVALQVMWIIHPAAGEEEKRNGIRRAVGVLMDDSSWVRRSGSEHS